MLYIVPGVSNRCCILPLELGVGAVYCLRSLEYVLYIVLGFSNRCCILSQVLGVGSVNCLRS